MKYIKLFEDFGVDDKLQDFCDNYLAYLIDYGFKVSLNYNEISILQPDDGMGLLDKTFSWDSVKDYVIPFIEVLYDEYNYDKLSDKIVFYTSIEKRPYIVSSFDNIIADNVFASDQQVINKILIQKPKF